MPFSQQSVDFLFENRLHDSREWFRDHKQTYAEQVTEPMKQLILDVAPAEDRPAHRDKPRAYLKDIPRHAP